MTIDEKDAWRLKFKIVAVVLVVAVLLIGLWLTLIDKVAAFMGIAGSIIAFATGVFGIDYTTSPKESISDRHRYKEIDNDR